MITSWSLVIITRFRLARGACGKQILQAFWYLWKRLPFLCTLSPTFGTITLVVFLEMPQIQFMIKFAGHFSCMQTVQIVQNTGDSTAQFVDRFLTRPSFTTTGTGDGPDSAYSVEVPQLQFF